MGSHHCGQSFCLPRHPTPCQALTLGGCTTSLVMYSFSFCGHVQHCNLSIIDLSYSVKHNMIDHVEWPELACQRHEIIVKHMLNPCWIFWWLCMYLNLRPLTGLTWVCHKSCNSIWSSLEVVHVPNYVQKTCWSNSVILMQIRISITHFHKTWTCNLKNMSFVWI